MGCINKIFKYSFKFINDVWHQNEKYVEGENGKIGHLEQIEPEYPSRKKKSEYQKDLVFPYNKKQFESYEKARARAENTFKFVVETRKFEIELYWKRATYFWTFITIIFGGYVTLVRTGNEAGFEAFLLVCIGFVVSLAWHLTNKGSKIWQRHWEKHLDLLEDEFIGPLYKTINNTKTYSVSKINEIVSFVFVISWVALFFNHVFSYYLQSSQSIPESTSVLMFLVTLGVALSTSAMFFGKGRGRFGKQRINMYKRTYHYSEEDE